MRGRTYTIVVELTDAPRDLDGLDGYRQVQALVRLHGTPIGSVTAPIRNGRVDGRSLTAEILDQLRHAIVRHLLLDLLAHPAAAAAPRAEDLVAVAHPDPVSAVALPTLTVAVCTRDRPDDLARCLEALARSAYPDLDVVVVDNAPRTDATARLVRERFPGVRYVREPRPGLDWARNRAILEARGAILAYTDDDVIVDAGWARAVGAAFARNPGVAALTGLVAPYELETDAQHLFEANGGFGRGFARRWWRTGEPGVPRWTRFGTGAFGTGANMAFRRSVFEQVGPFDPALDVGTPTNGGGDLDLLFRVVQAGLTVLYEPEALVFHRHRRDYPALRRQLDNNGIGLAAFLVREGLAFPRERRELLKLARWWVRHYALPRAVVALTQPGGLPRDLVFGEIVGGLLGPWRYGAARRAAARIARTFGPPAPPAAGGHAPGGAPAVPPPPPNGALSADPGGAGGPDGAVARRGGVAVRLVDLAGGVRPLDDLDAYGAVRVEVMRHGRPLGAVQIANGFEAVGADRLADEIVDQLGAGLLESAYSRRRDDAEHEATAAVRRRFLPQGRPRDAELAGPPPGVDVSVVVATRNRPDDLARCLESLTRQEAPRAIEVVIVDNDPASGQTPPVVARFPGVRLVSEPRGGLSYARNAGILASRGAIIAATDDDVVVPPHWVERLVQPFARPDVMAVTGQVLPLELETASQQAFEAYGGLGRGYDVREFGGSWFRWFKRRAVPTWELGATANSAFRASVFADPRIGLFDEGLGAGTPTGVAEDTYLYYKILKADYTLVYEPAAWVLHRHRRDDGALRHQIDAYSAGHVGYHLTTLFGDGDLRGLIQILVNLPRGYVWRLRERAAGRSAYPLGLLLTEVRGHLRGPWAMWQSRRRVRRLGRSSPTGTTAPAGATDAPGATEATGAATPGPAGPPLPSARRTGGPTG